MNGITNNLRNPPTRRPNTNQRRNSTMRATPPQRRNEERTEPVLLVVLRDI